MNINRSAMCTGIMALAMALPLAANAGIKATSQGEYVDVSTLNLHAPEGQIAAYTKLRNAAREVCDVESVQVLGSVQRAMERKQCYENSLQRAVELLNVKGVARIHDAS